MERLPVIPPCRPFTKYKLLNGLDDIDLTLRHEDKIAAYESAREG